MNYCDGIKQVDMKSPVFIDDAKQKKLCFKRLSETKFNWLPKFKLERVDSPSGRKYITPEGKSYQSVTTFLGNEAKDDIDAWRKAIGETEADKISKRAAGRGTKLHDNIEKYLLNENVEFPLISKLTDYPLFRSVKPLIDEIDNIRLLESPLYSHTLKLAGTIDCFADFRTIPSIIDFKSSTKLKDKYEIDSYFLQTACYSLMVEERYGIKVNQLVIIIATEHSRPLVHIDQRKNWFAPLRDLLRKGS